MDHVGKSTSVRREPIETERLRLVPVTDEQAAAILAGDLSVVRAGEGWPHADTLDGLRLAPGWLVELDGAVIGDCGVHGEPEGGTAEIGYGLAAPYRGRGYGSELVGAVSQWLLRQPGITRVVAETDPGNAASRRVLEKAGFHEAAVVYVLRRRRAGRTRRRRPR
jgi:RimJ/RimL family protein N-acetyltransferase